MSFQRLALWFALFAALSAAGCTPAGSGTTEDPIPSDVAATREALTPPPPVDPANASIPVGAQQQFTVSTAATKTPTAARWSVANPAIASVDANGLATGLTPGTTTITATNSAGQTGKATLVVNTAALTGVAVSPTTAVFDVGRTSPISFTATGVYSNGQKFPLVANVLWSSSNSAIATVTTSGVVTGISSGTATITATERKTRLSNAAVLTVTAAAVSAVNVDGPASIALGLAQPYAATIIFSDGSGSKLGCDPRTTKTCGGVPTTDVVWSLSNTKIASVDGSGVVTGLSAGTTDLVATYLPTGRTGTKRISVTADTLYAIAIEGPSVLPVAASVTLQAQITGITTSGTAVAGPALAKVTWSSSNEAIATVDSGGAVTALKAGSVVITATDPLSGVAGTLALRVESLPVYALEVTPSATTLPAGGVTQSFVATAIYQVSTAPPGSGVQPKQVQPGQLQAMRVDVTALAAWISSDQTVALVSNTDGSEGVVTTQAAGSATISAKYGGKVVGAAVTVVSASLTSIAVSPQTASIARGGTRQLTATGTFTFAGTNKSMTTDVSALAIWTSSAPEHATVSNAPGSEGLVSAKGVGTATITANVKGKTGTAWVTTTPATLTSMTISPAVSGMALDGSRQFTVTGIFSDSTHMDITKTVLWTSSKEGVATISNEPATAGLATARGSGSTQIGAYDPTTGQRAPDATLDVGNDVLTNLVVTPATVSVPNGRSQQFLAKGTFGGARVADMTSVVIWSVPTGTATASNAAGSYGVVTTHGTGTSIVQAMDPTTGWVATAKLTVTRAALASIRVTPTTPNIPLGTTQSFAATGVFTDGSTVDVTATVVWSADNGNASVSNASGQAGLATAMAAGTTTIIATDPTTGIVGSTVATMTPAALVSIAVTPMVSTLAARSTEQLTATGTYSDGSTRDVTAQVTWVSSAPLVFSISNAAGSNGLGTGLAYGSAVVSAIDPANQATGTATVRVTPLDRCAPSFGPAARYATGSAPVGLVTADLNGDGLLDLVSGDYLSGARVLLGRGDGTFSDGGEAALGNYLNAVSVADMNRDGRPDLVAPNYTVGTVSVALGNGDGTFQAPIVTPVPEANVVMAQPGDANGDGIMDLAIGINNPVGNLYILPGKGDGTFGPASAPYDLQGSTYERPAAARFVDLNGDRKQDLVIADTGTVAAVMLGNGDGSFASPVRYETGNYPLSIETGDVDGDGKLDIVVACYVSEQISVLRGNGDGTFSPHIDSLVGSWANYNLAALTLADLDGDSILDVALAGSYSNSVLVMSGNGDGTFSASAEIPVGTEPRGIVSADFDRNGIPDLAVDAEVDDQVTILANTCAP